MRHAIRLLLTLALALLLAQGVAPENRAQGAINALLEVWRLPNSDNGLAGIAYDGVENAVYYAAFNRDRVGRLEAATGQLTEWPVGDGPNGLTLGGAGPLLILQPPSVFFTESRGNRVGMLQPATDGYHAAAIPTPDSFPKGIDFYSAIARLDEAWFSERIGGRVGRVQGLQAGPLTPVPPTRQTLRATTQVVSVRQTLLPPTVHRGNPALPPAVMLAPRSDRGNVAEWDISGFYQGGDSFPEAVATTFDGAVWIANSAQETLLRLDPTSDVMAFYGLPQGSAAVDLAIDRDENVWYTTGFGHRVGKLDPRSGDVSEWTLPTAGQPLGLAVVDERSVWFTEREGDSLGWFDAATGELLSFRMPAGSHPLEVVAVASNEVWFTTERGDFLGHLTVTALGQPLTSDNAIHGFQLIQTDRKQADVTVDYSYEGGHGLPIWLDVDVLSGGVNQTDFGTVVARIDARGRGSATVRVIYTGNACVESDQLQIDMYDTNGDVFATQRFNASLRWNCA